MNEKNETNTEVRKTPPELNKTILPEQEQALGNVADEDVSKLENDDDFSWFGLIVVLVLIGAAVWGLMHYNPSKEEHFDAIEEVYADAIKSQYVNDTFSGNDAAFMNAIGGGFQVKNQMDKMKYKSIGIASWTYTKQHGHYVLSSIGACGMVFPLIEVR